MTNVEIKKCFGPQAVDILAEYETNYWKFMDISCKYGSILYENHFIDQAQSVLEQTLRYGCDLSKRYILLSNIYYKQHNTATLSHLEYIAQQNMKNTPLLPKVLDIIRAKELNSLTKVR